MFSLFNLALTLALTPLRGVDLFTAERRPLSE
jgi:hypothetical protein